MISHQYKCIFIHIPKTAGTSIEQKLGHFAELKRGVQDHRPISQIEPVYWRDLARPCLGLDSSTLMLQIKKAIKDKQANIRHCYNTYFKFSFVRNPWARVFSWYKNVMRDEHHKKRFGVSDNCSFKYFLMNHMDQWELKPQLFWLIDKKGNIPLDFIGRFEKLKDDFNFVAHKIGLKNKDLPKLIAGDGQHYIQFYDTEMENLIYNRYKHEIDYFNFKFGE
jgi:hypothetical protein